MIKKHARVFILIEMVVVIILMMYLVGDGTSLNSKQNISQPDAGKNNTIEEYLQGHTTGENYESSNIETTQEQSEEESEEESKEKKYIKWVDFGVSYQALCDAYKYDVESYEEEIHLNWIELLSYIAAKNGGNFIKYKSSQMASVANLLKEKKETIESLTKDMKYYNYYFDTYNAILGGFVGEYEVQSMQEDNDLQIIWKKTYGLKAFLPIAKNFPYCDFDDFGVSRTYGYKRKHLGHDMMGQVGTPIIAVESGYIEAIGWNQYGGWRIGIRSFDKKRYYYYAHLRKNYPYCSNLKEGDVVTAGDVIGYMGRTGYSTTENTNNIETSHLHFGIQIIFDESQKEGNGEIWIDCYNICRFLYKNRCETVKVTDSKEWKRIYDMKDPVAENYRNEQQNVIQQ